MYKLIIWKAIWVNSGDYPETHTDSYVLNYKPTFQDMYKHLNTDMIEITKGYDKDISNRSFDMYIDEESKLKPVVVKNEKATKAWYDWQERTKRQCLPGDFIAGHVAIIKKVNNDRKRSNEAA
nr:hypothetical protein [uncultured Mediterranean phage uvMED]